MTERRIEVAPQDETSRRQREIQTLCNIIWPDPEYQPILTDEAYIWDLLSMPCRLSPHREAAVRARLAHFFGGEFDLPLNVPLWQLVDLIQGRWPDWPEGMTEPCWDRSS